MDKAKQLIKFLIIISIAVQGLFAGIKYRADIKTGAQEFLGSVTHAVQGLKN